MALNKRTYTEHETKITAQNLNEMQDEIIANGQRSNKNMNRLNAIGWTQEQIDAFKELLGITEHPEIDEPTFAAGDIYPDTGKTWLASGAADSTTILYFQVSLPKNLKNINTITFVPNDPVQAGIKAYGINGTMESSVNAGWFKDTEDWTFTVTPTGDYSFIFKMQKSSAITGATAKTPVAFFVRGNFVFS